MELEKGGHVTPLAWDTLRARRVTVVPAGTVDAALPADLAPVAPSESRCHRHRDHTGLAAARRRSSTTCANRDRRSSKTRHDVERAGRLSGCRGRRRRGRWPAGEADAGIVIDGAGLGSAIAANKVRGVRAAMCTTPTLARYSREHNGANVLALGATLLRRRRQRAEIVDVWLSTPTREAAIHAAAAEDSPNGGVRSDGRASPSISRG